MPVFEAPVYDAPVVKAPDFKAPVFKAPSLPFASSPKVEDNIPAEEPQDVRDERARQARTVFLSYDDDAKELEAKANQAREVANEKKKLASDAKDEACKTHWGGKVLCLRSLNSGY